MHFSSHIRWALIMTLRKVQANSQHDGSRAKSVVLFSTNDYLGLASHPDVKSAVATAAAQWGNGTRASAIVAGHTHVHEQLEQRLADLKGTEAALLFPTGALALHAHYVGGWAPVKLPLCMGRRRQHARSADVAWRSDAALP